MINLSSRYRNLVGGLLLLLALAVNEKSLSWLLNRQIAFSTRTSTAILFFEIGCVLAGLAVFTARFKWGQNLQAALLAWTRWAAQPLTSKDWLWGYFPLILTPVIRHFVGWNSQTEFTWHHPAVALILVQDVAQSMLLAAAAFSLTGRVFSQRWVYVIVGIIFGAVASIDIGFLMYARIRASLGLLVGTSGAVGIYLGPTTLLISAVCIVGCVLSALWFGGRARAVAGPTVSQRICLALIVSVTWPGELIYYTATVFVPGSKRASMDTHLEEAKRYEGNALLYLSLREIFTDRGILVAEMSEQERSLFDKYKNTNPDSSSSLSGKPFRRIILITMESLTTTLTSKGNKALPGKLTPRIDALEPSSELLSGSLPTAFGLASHLTSHPNGQAVVQVGHPNALPKYLDDRGWRTAFFQSASLDFQSGARRFKEMGYRHIAGKEAAESDPRLASYISGWGLCDRKVYEVAIDWLAANQGQPAFIHILTADTHSPSGRLDWHGLDYPATPNWIHNTGIAAMLLESFFRADHDLGLFLDALKARGLWDEDTAVIITGDHSCPLGPTYNAVPGVSRNVIGSMPFILLSGRDIKWDHSRLASQIDTAPTIADMAGFAPEAHWWGRSLLKKMESKPVLGWRGPEGYIVLPDGDLMRMSREMQHAGWSVLK